MAKKVITKKTTTSVKKATNKKPAAKKTTTTKRKTKVRVNKAPAHRASSEKQDLACRVCGVVEQKSVDVLAYTCWQCTTEVVGREGLPQPKKPTGFPRGWAFMKEFVHEDGRVYHKGVEQPKLKGTKKPTPIKVATPKPKKSKVQRAREKQELLVKFTELKKQIKKEKRVTYRRKLETQLRKIEKQL